VPEILIVDLLSGLKTSTAEVFFERSSTFSKKRSPGVNIKKLNGCNLRMFVIS
jgi:hypothetical protein